VAGGIDETDADVGGAFGREGSSERATGSDGEGPTVGATPEQLAAIMVALASMLRNNPILMAR
jgi:hypothetical protein